MSTQKHILIVEDVPFIYHEVEAIVSAAGFSVDRFTSSVKDAIARINKKRPDLVLLDIQLKGEQNGVYLGNLLKTEYHIPFIYVTDYDDDFTFNKSSQTNPEAFIPKKRINLFNEDIIIKTKPELDEKQLIREMVLILQRTEKRPINVLKDGIMAFVDLPKNLNDAGSTEVSQRPVKYEDIEFFTSKIIDINSSSLPKEKIEELKKEGRNIAKLITINKEPFYFRGNLSKIIETLPYNFVRINSSEILNVTVNSFDGRINGRHLVIADKVYTISDTYKEEVEKRIAHFY
ncbi:response regulator transcription factor [Psychroserpens luteus]|uniref:Response regulator transcription factor n=1 Tax=Psychroserpens luteus TaxID=1434066 RepID=A0ABW5ZV56_9FLAO|nr:response regulator [Psychroserpens luteus]